MEITTLDPTTAAAALQSAIARRDRVISDAARGEPTTAQDLRAAENAVRDAETDHALAGAIGQHTKKQGEIAHVAALQATADGLAQRRAELIANDLGAAQALDMAILRAREAALAREITWQALAAHEEGIRGHNMSLDHEAVGNPTLAAKHRSEWPKVESMQGGHGGAQFGYPLRVELVQTVFGPQMERNGPHDVVQLRPAEELVRGAYGRFGAGA